jgi:hypothetical protein
LKDRQHNGQKKKDKQRSAKHTLKTKDQVTQTPLKTKGEPRYSGDHTNLYTIYDNIPIIMKDPSFVFGNPLLSSCIFCCENLYILVYFGILNGLKVKIMKNGTYFYAICLLTYTLVLCVRIITPKTLNYLAFQSFDFEGTG